jgi:hypothetical protein
VTAARRDPESGTRQDALVPSPTLHGRTAAHGPTRRMHRRHFARMESGGMFAMLLIAAVAVYFVGTDLGLLPDLFGWRR